MEDWRKIKWIWCRDGCYVWSKITRELVGLSCYFIVMQRAGLILSYKKNHEMGHTHHSRWRIEIFFILMDEE